MKSDLRFTLKQESDSGASIRALFYAGKNVATGSVATYSQIERAATKAVKQGGTMLKDQGRANIRAAGFSSRWANAWRVNFYPKKGDSIDAAAFAFHKIPYSEIFETGGTIRAKRGLLWIPLATVPKDGPTGKQASPRSLIRQGVKLFTIKGRPGGRPLIAANVRGTKAFFGRKSPAVSFSALRTGTGKGTKRKSRQKVVTVPLFFGMPAVTLRKRFELATIAGKVQARLGELYFANVEG